MKSLIQYIREAKEINKKEIRLELPDFEDKEKFILDLISVCQQSDIYVEKIEKGCKFYLKGEDLDKYTKIFIKIEDYCNSTENEELKKVLSSVLTKINDWKNSTQNNETPEKDNNKEEE